MKDYDYGSKPISAWGYVGRSILWSIPVVGWLILLFKALFARNRNVKNYARSFFCALLLVLIIVVIAGVGLAVGVYTAEDLKVVISDLTGITL